MGWAPGYKEAVELWNKKNPNTQVKWIATEASRKIYPKMLTAVKANNAPDLAQVGYEALPSFVIKMRFKTSRNGLVTSARISPQLVLSPSISAVPSTEFQWILPRWP